ncbi:sarcosine oxidase subunit delta [Sphingobium sp. LMA1-1-1.1]|uniref:sarcosine oxidase subunit delta n=1 Tax=unclassified Sphingobium TaxID=2611147 RepID=UPI0034238F1E
MLLIHCPWCGPRDEIEFQCGGQSHITRPGPPEEVSDERWAQYLFERINPRGLHRERWLHAYGCRRWFNVARDTATHAILEIYPMNHASAQAVEQEGQG